VDEKMFFVFLSFVVKDEDRTYVVWRVGVFKKNGGEGVERFG
jgi:hypothetical protein